MWPDRRAMLKYVTEAILEVRFNSPSLARQTKLVSDSAGRLQGEDESWAVPFIKHQTRGGGRGIGEGAA